MPRPNSQLLPRTEAELQNKQRQGALRVCTAAAFRELVDQQGLEAAYGATDVVVASNAEFTDQASLVLHLGPTDPPLRIRRFQLGGVEGLGGSGSTDLVLPIGQGGAQVLESLLAGAALPFSAQGEPTVQQPRRELKTQLGLAQIGAGRLLLHRGIAENGVVAVSSAEGLIPTPWGPVLGPMATALYSCGGAGSIGLTMPGLGLLGPGSPVLVAGALGWVCGAGSGHHPAPRRGPGGHARSPGSVAALAVDLAKLERRWVRATQWEGLGSGLMVAVAAPVPLLDLAGAAAAAAGNDQLEAPVLDFGIPRRVRPSYGTVSYRELMTGQIRLGERLLRAAPAHSRRLADGMAERLVEQLQAGEFPLRLPITPLAAESALLPLDG